MIKIRGSRAEAALPWGGRSPSSLRAPLAPGERQPLVQAREVGTLSWLQVRRESESSASPCLGGRTPQIAGSELLGR